ncbi:MULTISPECIES: HepT-like ribonuclease domain-containing protein [Bacteroides]|nr:HepT-like ribonuclease domain-containing protein [Bacteroides sp.]
MELQDIIAHEYHHIDAEEIFKVIKIDFPILHNTILKMKSDF